MHRPRVFKVTEFSGAPNYFSVWLPKSEVSKRAPVFRLQCVLVFFKVSQLRCLEYQSVWKLCLKGKWSVFLHSVFSGKCQRTVWWNKGFTNSWFWCVCSSQSWEMSVPGMLRLNFFSCCSVTWTADPPSRRSTAVVWAIFSALSSGGKIADWSVWIFFHYMQLTHG